MVQKGMALRYREEYEYEVKLAKNICFDFFQLWFFNGSLSVDSVIEPKEIKIKKIGYPVILHAVFDINDFEKHGRKLLDLVDYFEHREVIIHPICTSEKITKGTVYRLREKLDLINEEFIKRQVRLFVENNSVVDGFFNTVEELQVVFKNNQDIGLLLDLAHINSYEHLKDIVKMRKPECIHISDRRFGVPHEHITLGNGDLDFKMIFNEIITAYSGKVILEAVDSWESIQKSKKIMDKLF